MLDPHSPIQPDESPIETDQGPPKDDPAEMYNHLPEDGSTITNPRLQAELGWSDERYWAARDQLEDAKLVVRGRGRGGVLRRIVDTPIPSENTTVVAHTVTTTEEAIEVVESTTVREDLLYQPILSVLTGDWIQDRRSDPIATEITARQGRRSTGGTWSRPDLVSVEVKAYEYVPGKFLEVVTFEVKPVDAIDVSAVYEALAHRRAATHAYVMLHVPSDQTSTYEAAVTEVRLVARSHGIGLIVMADPADYSTWDELEEAERVEANPERLNQFIESQLSSRLKRKLARTLR